VHRREVPYAIRVRISGESITVSPNHPFFTGRGWVGAQDLEPGDVAMEATAAMRMVRGNLHAPHESGGAEAILQSILLSEMAHESTGVRGEDSHPGDCGEARQVDLCVVRVGQSVCAEEHRAHSRAQSDVVAGISREGEPRVESHEPQTFRAWGERDGFDRAAEGDARCSRTELGTGIEFVTGPTDSGLSIALQARLGERRAASRYRSGW